jgi:Zn-dependent protease with chaperone function
MSIKGSYLDGKTSKRVNARLEVSYFPGHNPDQCQSDHTLIRLHIEGLDPGAHSPIKLEYGALKIESRLGNTPREIAFGQGQLFITHDNDAIDELIKAYNQSSPISLLHKLENNLSLIFFATIATVVLSWSVVVYGIPASAKFIAHQLPEFTTEQLGSGLSILDETLFDPSELEASRQQEIRRLVTPYFEQYTALNPSLHFRSGMAANAFALPNGEIVLTDDFVNLTKNDEELLAVIFHELGHLKHKHMARRALQGSMITLLVIIITGDLDTFDLLTGLPTLILDLSYSREFESESDLYALEQMHHFEIPVDHFATIMQRLNEFYLEKNETVTENLNDEAVDKKSTIAEFFSTHPSTDERIKLVAKFKKLEMKSAAKLNIPSTH